MNYYMIEFLHPEESTPARMGNPMSMLGPIQAESESKALAEALEHLHEVYVDGFAISSMQITPADQQDIDDLLADQDIPY